MVNDLKTSELSTKVMRYWWILVGLMILAGLVGLLVSHFIPPVYESESVITSTLDYSQLGRINDWGQDQVYKAIGNIIGSSEVKRKAVEQANLDGWDITLDDFEAKTSLDRQDTRWVMRVRDDSPKNAKKLNNYWAEAAMNALSEMNSKNAIVFAYQQYINSLTNCFEESVMVDPASVECNTQNLDEIRQEIAEAAENTSGINYSTSLILTHTSYALTTEPTLPSSPVLLARGWMVFAGAMIGLCLGFILFLSDWPKEKQAGSL